MFNFYIFNPSYQNASITDLEVNLQSLQEIFEGRKDNEVFLKHDSIWDVEVQDGIFADVVFSRLEDKQFSVQVLPNLLQQINSIDPSITSMDEFDERYRLYNALYGINFHGVPEKVCVRDINSYTEFIDANNWELTPQTLWERREELFSRTVLCPSVERQISTIGGTYLNQIVKRIKDLDEYVSQNWLQGNFSYNNANNNSSLNISPESKSTMQQQELVNLRMFSLPDGRRECFELHIKTGNLRFHFFTENLTVYVGYIGVHLKTSRF